MKSCDEKIGIIMLCQVNEEVGLFLEIQFFTDYLFVHQ
jgi:hypothetical protein